MADLGKVVITDGGNYDPDTTYEKITFVHYGSDTYMTLKTVTGITPIDDGVNYKLFCRSAELATADVPGTVKPDGTTITVDEETGALSSKTATQSEAGIVKGSAGIKVGPGGTLDVNTAFTQATELANIIANEAIATVLGKVSKTIATTMNLDQNAVLKNMLTNIDADDQNKIPTTKLTHALWNRIGMGEDLDIGANLTAVVKALNSNLNNNAVVSTGLSLNWGTVEAGGYTRIGKMVIVNIRIRITTSLSTSNAYTISGFPGANYGSSNTVPIQCNAPTRVRDAYMQVDGVIAFRPETTFNSNEVILLHGCYMTA